jgi:hypothetical protein
MARVWKEFVLHEGQEYLVERETYQDSSRLLAYMEKWKATMFVSCK